MLLGACLIPAQAERVCPFGLCQLDVLDQWNWRQEGEGAGRGGEKSVWAGWQLCVSGPRGWVNTLPFTLFFVLSVSGIQTQLCTCMHKHAKADSRVPIQIPLEKHLHTHTHTHTLFLGQGRSSRYLNTILLLTGLLTRTLLCLIHRI